MNTLMQILCITRGITLYTGFLITMTNSEFNNIKLYLDLSKLNHHILCNLFIYFQNVDEMLKVCSQIYFTHLLKKKEIKMP